ncbi:PAS domain-containing protein [Roseimicrobium sp. ORNL1]|uniref:PAS domain-containing protein n=1 Tax=Roseimicrobium sp. ORNL1 TaxID=2711231 RepID=UPI0013E16DDA|nr:PAS domain-containing protein [Roseimicrobium sp. ORNL1]QIF01086.1 PAS domain-containing protein [Roseimicrobium sp. ORNL1]
MASRATKIGVSAETQLRERIRELEAQVRQEQSARKAWLASEERFAMAVRGTNDGIWDWTVRTQEIYYSPRFKELLGYGNNELSNKFIEWESRLHPEDKARTMEALNAHLERDLPYDVEYRLRCKDGGYRWFRARGKAIRNPDGTPHRMAGAITDITERKEAMRALAESEERFALAVRGANDGIWDWDILTNQVYFSPRWKAMVGYEDHELENVFATFEALLHPDDHDRVMQAVNDYLDGRMEGYAVEFRFRHRDGSYRWMLARGMALRDAKGRPYRMAGSHTDVTEQKQSLYALAEGEEQLRLAKQAAEMANRAKSEFLANMSHEIRTPMNGILGLTELLLNMHLSPEQRSYETLVRQSAESLLTILNDILDFSKIEAGKLGLDDQEFRLRDAIGDTLQSLGVRAAEKNLELACHIEPGVPEILVGDIARLRQVLVNLVGNAVKFTHEGEVVVEVRVEALSEGHVMLHFSVKDTGIGIAEEQHHKIFEAFTQAESSTTRHYGGTGLGLTICRQLVEMMDGRIWVESTPGAGSTFHFTAQLGLVTEPVPCKRPEPGVLKGLHVLVVDDNATNRLILDEMLKGWQMIPTCVASGVLALELLGSPKGRIFNLVLMDVMMPGMDGMEVSRRAHLLLGSDAPKILMLSSAGHLLQLANSPQTGIERVLTKPVKQSDLFDAIVQILDLCEDYELGDTCPFQPLPSHPLRPLNVLLVEDGRVNQLVATRMLEDRGHAVSVANNGREALEMLSQESYDAIVMDVHMPELNGFETTAMIREQERESGGHLPIIAMTANAMKGDRERCMAAGMDDYVSKPVRSGELYRAVESFTTVPLSARGGTPPCDMPDPLEPDPDSVFDAAAFRESISDEGLMRQLVEIYPEDSEDMLLEAETALRDKDRAALHQAAHSLKGLLGNYSAPIALEAARTLSRLAREDRLKDAAPVLADTIREVRRLADALKAFGKTLPAEPSANGQ